MRVKLTMPALKFETPQRPEIGMHEGEIFDVRHLSHIRPYRNFSIGESNSAVFGEQFGSKIESVTIALANSAKP